MGGVGVSFQTTDTLDQVVKFYTATLKGTRWQLMQNNTTAGIASISWRAAKSFLGITIRSQSGLTKVMIVITNTP